MTRTSDWFLDCVFYIYNSELAANENDERVGGSGFLVAKRRPDNPRLSQRSSIRGRQRRHHSVMGRPFSVVAPADPLARELEILRIMANRRADPAVRCGARMFGSEKLTITNRRR